MKQAETAMADAMFRAGANRAETRLRQIILDALRKHHRNIGRAMPAIIRAVEDDDELIAEALLQITCRLDAEMLGNGQSAFDNLTRDARPQQPVPTAATVQPTVVYRDKIGKFAPEPSQLYKNIAAKGAQKIALTVFETFKVRDGRGIGFVRWGELASLREADEVSACVIRNLMMHTIAEHDALVRDVVKATDLVSMIDRAKEQVHAL